MAGQDAGFYRQLAAGFRAKAASAQAEKATIDAKVQKLESASRKLSTEINRLVTVSRTMGQLLPLDSSNFKGSRQEDFEQKFSNMGSQLSQFYASHQTNKETIDAKARALKVESDNLQTTISSYYRQAAAYDRMGANDI